MKTTDLVLVIDLQNVYRPGQPWSCASFDRALEKILTLLETVDRRQVPPQVVLTQFMADPNATGMWAEYNRLNHDINSDPWMSEMVPQLSLWMKRFPLYQKSTYSSLSVPQVRDAALKAGRLVVTGVVAECCVLATCMEAIDLGLHVVYLRDGCAGADARTEAAVESALAGLSPPHITFMTTEEYLKEE